LAAGRTNILARMEPGKGRLRLIRGSLELSDGPFRTAAVLDLPKLVNCTQQADHPPRYINRLFSSAKTGRAKPRARLVNRNSVTTTEFRKHGAVIKNADRTNTSKPTEWEFGVSHSARRKAASRADEWANRIG